VIHSHSPNAQANAAMTIRRVRVVSDMAKLLTGGSSSKSLGRRRAVLGQRCERYTPVWAGDLIYSG
jgi:hypothetical protein